MAEETTKDFGPFYVGWVRFDPRFKPPRMQRGWSNEIEAPFRRGICITARVRPGLCIALGVWRRPRMDPAQEGFAYLDEDEQDDVLDDIAFGMDEPPEVISTWTPPDWSEEDLLEVECRRIPEDRCDASIPNWMRGKKLC